MKAIVRRAVPVLLMFGCAVTALVAQEPVGEFVPIRPGDLEQEQIPAARLVFAAYAFVWVALLAYVLVLWQRLRRIDADLVEVKSRLGGRRR